MEWAFLNSSTSYANDIPCNYNYTFYVFCNSDQCPPTIQPSTSLLILTPSPTTASPTTGKILYTQKGKCFFVNRNFCFFKYFIL